MSTLNKIEDKVSDALSYPARRAAQKSMINDDNNVKALKNRSASDKKNFKWAIEKPDNELIATPQMKQKAALMNMPKKQVSQKDMYAKAMNSAMKKGGSNGIGIGK